MLECPSLLDSIGSSDTLERIHAHLAVYSLVESLAKYNIPQDEIVDAVYDIATKLRNSLNTWKIVWWYGYESAVLIMGTKVKRSENYDGRCT